MDKNRARKKVVDRSAKKDAVDILCWAGISERRACELVGLSRASNRYVSKRIDDDCTRSRIVELANERRRFGYRRLQQLLAMEGRNVNQKKVYRIYCEEGLQVRKRKRRKLTGRRGLPFVMPTQPNERWSMDFVSDTFTSGRKFRTLNIIDDFTRESIAIEVATSIPGQRVIRVIEQLIAFRGKPQSIVSDNGPEFRCGAMLAWSKEKDILQQFIDPGKPMQNALVESFNGRFRDECLNENLFFDIQQARTTIENWRHDYNNHRPHSGLGGKTPKEFYRMNTTLPLAV